MTKEKKQNAVIQAAKSVTGYEQIKEAGQLIRSMVAALDPRRVRMGHVETFDEARTRLMVNNGEIEKVRFNQVCIFWGVFAVLVCAWAVFSGQPFGFMYLLMMLGFSAMCLALMFRASFRHSQIRARKLHSVQEWASNRGHWLPWF